MDFIIQRTAHYNFSYNKEALGLCYL